MPPRSSSGRRRATLAAPVALLLLLLTACGSNSDGGGGSSKESVDSSGLTAAQDYVKKYSAEPTKIPNNKPIGKPVPTGKRVTFLSCGTSTCNLEADIIKQATDKLGWDFTSVANNGTPEQTQAAWQQVLRTKPDGVLVPSIDVASVKNYLANAEKAGIEVVSCCTVDPPRGALKYVIGTPAQTVQPGGPGNLMAAWVVAESAGKGSSVYVNISAFKILDSVREGFDTSMKKFCPSCSTNSIDIPITSLGKDVPDRIVSYLRSHSDVKYVALSVDGALGAGLPAALKAAGLNDVKVIGEGPDENTLQYIASGQQEATVTFPYYEEMFSMVDALARIQAGVPLETDVTVPSWLVTKDTLPDSTQIFPVVKDVREQYFKLWGVS